MLLELVLVIFALSVCFRSSSFFSPSGVSSEETLCGGRDVI